MELGGVIKSGRDTVDGGREGALGWDDIVSILNIKFDFTPYNALKSNMLSAFTSMSLTREDLQGATKVAISWGEPLSAMPVKG